MAGNYPDVPAPRMAYDRDGTVVATISGSTVTEQSSGTVSGINSESTSGYIDTVSSSSFTWYLGFLFPEIRDFSGWFAAAQGVAGAPSFRELEWSSDTTNLYDGSWTNSGDSGGWGGTTSASARNGISTLPLSNIKAVRMRVTSGGNAASDRGRIYFVHLFGVPAAGQNVDRLRIWHPTLDQPLDNNDSTSGAYLDWGDVARSTTQDRQFRIKNNSPTYTANNIDVGVTAPTNTSPDLPAQFTMSDGGAFQSGLTIASIAPDGISAPLTVRRITPSNANLSLWTLRISADPGSWT